MVKDTLDNKDIGELLNMFQNKCTVSFSHSEIESLFWAIHKLNNPVSVTRGQRLDYSV